MRRLPALLLLALLLPACRPHEAPVAVLGALEEEVALLRPRLTDPVEERVGGMSVVSGRVDGRPVVLARAGVGKVNAATAAALLLSRYKPRAVLFTGIAGAVDPRLKPGDLVIGVETAQHDHGMLTDAGLETRATKTPDGGERNPLMFPADPALAAAALEAARSQGLSVSTGVIVTGDSFIASPRRRAQLRKGLGASAVEMEGAAVAQVCRRFDTPFLAVRSISDRADGTAVKDFHRFRAEAAQVSARLVLALLSAAPER